VEQKSVLAACLRANFNVELSARPARGLGLDRDMVVRDGRPPCPRWAGVGWARPKKKRRMRFRALDAGAAAARHMIRGAVN